MTRAGRLKMRSSSAFRGNGAWQFVHTVVASSRTSATTACSSNAQCWTGGASYTSSNTASASANPRSISPVSNVERWQTFVPSMGCSSDAMGYIFSWMRGASGCIASSASSRRGSSSYSTSMSSSASSAVCASSATTTATMSPW